MCTNLRILSTISPLASGLTEVGPPIEAPVHECSQRTVTNSDFLHSIFGHAGNLPHILGVSKQEDQRFVVYLQINFRALVPRMLNTESDFINFQLARKAAVRDPLMLFVMMVMMMVVYVYEHNPLSLPGLELTHLSLASCSTLRSTRMNP